jgi:osmotically-inducible protein OsmY
MAANSELQRDIKYNIYKALQRTAELDCEQISVEISKGTVTLSGIARTWAERDDAERAAWAAPGVRKVQNEIRIAADTGLKVPAEG